VANDYHLALQIIDSTIRTHGLDDPRPPRLHHYTSLTAALSILREKDIRLCHAEYLNDLSEVRGAIALIVDMIHTHINANRYVSSIEHFCNSVESAFDTNTRMYEVFVFCMSEGDPQNPPGYFQDVLDSWRVYGANGRGVCLSFDSQDFMSLSSLDGGTRLSKIVYSKLSQERIIRYVLDEGYRLQSSNTQDAILATVAALIFLVPIFKDSAFQLEREWRFIYLPTIADPSISKRKFYVREDLIIPFYSMEDDDHKVKGAPVPIEIMMGPSPHQLLNIRSLDYIRNRAAIKASLIPYRG
jgi:hypothetical protein